MKQNNNEMQRIIEEDIKNENKQYPDCFLNLKISYVVWVIAFKEIKQVREGENTVGAELRGYLKACCG